jgi:methylenetetrahydrofolate reductase (NADPH)
MPDDLVKEVEKAATDEAMLEVGIEWSIAQCKELIKEGVPCIHFYTMGDVNTICRILKAIL